MTFNLEKENYSKSEVEGLLQSETDRVRTAYSKKLKETEKERDALKTPEKSEAEKALEKREAELAKRERVLACKEAGISDDFAELLRDDADLSTLSELFKSTKGYVPNDKGKGSGASMTKKEFEALSYSQQAKLYQENPELFNALIK